MRTHITDSIHDIAINIMQDKRKIKTIPAHSLVLASRSQLFSKMIILRKDDSTAKETDNVKCLDICVENVLPDVFSAFLEFMYSGKEPSNDSKYRVCKGKHVKVHWADEVCDFQKPVVSVKGKKKERYVEMEFFEVFHDYARHFGLRTSMRHNNNITPGKFSFDHDSFPELFDCEVECDDGILFSSHKCLLAARIPYFQGMLESYWMETAMGRGEGLSRLKVCT